MRTVEPLRQDSSFAEMEESHPVRLPIVLSESAQHAEPDVRYRGRRRS